MEDQLKVLETINKHVHINQKFIGQLCNFSAGKVNYLIRDLMEKGLIGTQKHGRSTQYYLTKQGIRYLKNRYASYQDKKVYLHGGKTAQVKEVVILAAGETKEFNLPVSLLPLDGTTLLQRNINILRKHGIEKIIIVTGYKKEAFSQLFDEEGIIFVENPRYQWTGSMSSLACAKNVISGDFLVLEHDILIEEQAFTQLINNEQRDCMLIATESGLGNEAYVELRNQYIFKISKDLHQLNRINGEMVGISKISYDVFQLMLEEYKENQNPFLNYEYLLLDVSRQYKIGYLKINDLIWSDIDTKEHYIRILNLVYPKLKRKEEKYFVHQFKETISSTVGIPQDQITGVSPLGGMTNKNYKISVAGGKEYVLRIPGAGTKKMIDRRIEKENAVLASRLGINANILYFDENKGMKISEMIPDAETLTPKMARREGNMKLVAGILKKLHTSGIPMKNKFDIGQIKARYEQLVDEVNGHFYPNFRKLKEEVLKIKAMYDAMQVPLVPCHNDTLPDNFVKSGDDRIYLIDWEYAGLNDPVWDLAAYSLESSFTEREEELFLSFYFPEGITEKIRMRMLMHKIFQDYIWSLWTVYKEAKGDNFGDYGITRYNRAIANTEFFLSKKVSA
ncbi:phosphotransferase [Thermoactinomyces mirandus]|uniref:Phosphotransferase n=1 Tax=Thermoactinomyces mirandus TaxID=2756294 RepID=A0A7W1XU26_9BACL|nr:phosphotransferase [Thermoactinomyces mirandus]MBA4603107.1 phosphotransferase [Thermoactinomyces mirandus]